MGENMNFPATDVVDKEKPKSGLTESTQTGLNFLSVSSGFYFITFSMISIFFSTIIGVLFYFSIMDTVETSEMLFKKYGTDILLVSSDTLENAVKTSKYAGINEIIKNLYDKQGIDAENKMIQEIFYLDRKGTVYAHTDLTKLTNSANTTLNKVSSIYNNELFHTGLMMSKNEVNVQPYPYETYNRDRSYLYLIKYLLPREYFDTMDYSIPVFVGKRPMGTFHVVINRVFSDTLLKQYLLEISVIWLGSILAAALLALFIKLPFSSRLKKVNVFVKNYLRENAQPNVEKTALYNKKDEVDYIDQKIAEMVKIGMAQTSSINKKNEIKDAYLIREN
jgi:hypothetical protein